MKKFAFLFWGQSFCTFCHICRMNDLWRLNWYIQPVLRHHLINSWLIQTSTTSHIELDWIYAIQQQKHPVCYCFYLIYMLVKISHDICRHIIFCVFLCPSVLSAIRAKNLNQCKSNFMIPVLFFNFFLNYSNYKK